MPLIEDEYGRRRYVSHVEAYGVDIHAADVPAQCPNCLGTRAPSATDPEWKGRCECVEPAARLDYLSSCSLERLLLELLATLHGDDGNHTDKVGMARSVYDAEAKICAAPDYESRVDAARACGAVVTQHEIGFTHAEFAAFLASNAKKSVHAAAEHIDCELETFECDHISRTGTAENLHCDPAGRYRDPIIRARWEGWQSRATYRP